MFQIKRYYLKRFLGIFFCLYCLQASGQGNSLPAIEAAFNGYQKSRLQEKIYVHTDKAFYLAGELVWFKIYCVDAADNRPLDMSKLAYVEILDGANKPVMQAKIALENGSGYGSFLLPASVGSGSYLFRAYTAWMKNFSADYYFSKPITIINTLKAGGVQQWNDTATFSARFYPEGGNLVAGLESKVGFKVTDRYGKGVLFSGIIINQQGDTITWFSPMKFGMGSFTFTPQADHKYKAVITTEGGGKMLADLPAAYPKGYVMHVADDGGNRLSITVKTNIAAVENAPDVFLLATTRQRAGKAAQAVFRNGTATFTVDKSSLGDGISQFTIFNGQQQPVCERLFFKQPVKQLDIDLKSDLQQYATRRKVSVAVALKSAAQAGTADMSVAVFRLDSLSTPDGNDIISYLWLSSDLAGTVESPGYYFNNGSPDALAAADNLMLTHGWRRFQWNDILENKAPAFRFAPEYSGHIVYSKITNTQTGMPAPGIGAYLSIPGTQVQLYNTQSDAQGHLAFQTKPFYGPNELIIQTKTNKDSIYRIDLVNPFADQYSSARLPALRFSTAWQQALVRQSVRTQVQHNFTGKELSQFALPAVDTLPFFGKPTMQYLLDKYVRFTTMEEVLREYVMEVGVRKRGSNYLLPVMKSYENGFYEGSPLLLLDGVPVFDNNKIISYDPLKVRKLEVVTNRYYFGPFVFDGIVSFTTFNGALEGMQLHPSAIVVDYEGLQLRRQFHMPVYDTPEQVQSRMPDFRSLLFFSPDLRVNGAGKTQFAFYTSDVPGKYMIVLQGISTEGVPGSQSLLFDVH